MHRIIYYYTNGTHSPPRGRYATLHQAIGIAEIRINAPHVSNHTHPVQFVQITLNGKVVWDSRTP